MKQLKCFFIMICFLLTSCSPSPTNVWLSEYEALLQQGISVYNSNPSTDQMDSILSQIAEKEAELDNLLRTTSMQEKINFLSKYYDMRVQFYYAVK